MWLNYSCCCLDLVQFFNLQEQHDLLILFFPSICSSPSLLLFIISHFFLEKNFVNWATEVLTLSLYINPQFHR